MGTDPVLADHIKAQGPPLEGTSVLKWFIGLYTARFPIKMTLRIWDCFLNEGIEVIHRVGLNLLKRNRVKLLKSEDYEMIITEVQAIGRRGVAYVKSEDKSYEVTLLNVREDPKAKYHVLLDNGQTDKNATEFKPKETNPREINMLITECQTFSIPIARHSCWGTNTPAVERFQLPAGKLHVNWKTASNKGWTTENLLSRVKHERGKQRVLFSFRKANARLFKNKKKYFYYCDENGTYCPEYMEALQAICRQVDFKGNDELGRQLAKVRKPKEHLHDIVPPRAGHAGLFGAPSASMASGARRRLLSPPLLSLAEECSD